ncbi:MAG: DUF2442 domain-containing protein [Candidatus Riflebacteria bacterium]|nr:DUF2442 domain-containing protein [Candidatus Riflebacteria bacterium]
MTINKRPNWFVDNVEANDDYTLLLTFITGEIKLFDFKPLLDDNYFEPLKNIAFFKKAHISGRSVIWNDEIDIAPEYLYENGVLVK